MLETLRTDRNQYRKTLLEQKNDRKEYKRKFMNLNTEIKTLKDQIDDKDVGALLQCAHGLDS